LLPLLEKGFGIGVEKVWQFVLRIWIDFGSNKDGLNFEVSWVLAWSVL